jgi:hypothetical protein
MGPIPDGNFLSIGKLMPVFERPGTLWLARTPSADSDVMVAPAAR